MARRKVETDPVTLAREQKRKHLLRIITNHVTQRGETVLCECDLCLYASAWQGLQLAKLKR